MRKCPRCGAENADDNKWCISCMKPLEKSSTVESDYGSTAGKKRLSGSMGHKTYQEPDERKTAGDKTQSRVSGFAHPGTGKGSDQPDGTRNSRLSGSIGNKKYEYGTGREKAEYDTASKHFEKEPPRQYCKRCGSLIESSALFCTRCGTPVGASGPATSTNNSYSRPSGGGALVWVAVLIVVLLAGTVGALFMRDRDQSTAYQPVVPNTINGYGERVYENGDYVFTPDEEHIAFEETSNTIYFDNLLVVYTFENLSAGEVEKLADTVGGRVAGKLSGAINLLQIKVSKSSLDELTAMADLLMLDSRVLYASHDFPMELMETAADSNPWNDGGTPENDRGNENNPAGNDWWAEAIVAYTSWNYVDYCTPIRVGIIDSGFWNQHPELSGKISFLPNYPSNTAENHGTHVAGVIAARNNTIGIRGVADSASLICADWSPHGKVNYLSTGEYTEIMKQLVENNVRVINNSWGMHFQSERGYTGGIPSFIFNLFKAPYASYVNMMEEYSRDTAQACMLMMIELLLNGEEDFLIVQSAGNGYDNGGPGVDAKYSCYFCGVTEDIFSTIQEDADMRSRLAQNGITYETLRDRIIIVGAVDNQMASDDIYLASYFSNYGETVDIFAPGRDVYSTVRSKAGWFGKEREYIYANLSGTSMAAPIVAGSAAQVWSLNPALSASEVKDCLINSASCLAFDADSNTVYPMLNVGNAVKSLNIGTGSVMQPDERETSDERDIVLVLDSSGSMDGTPIHETRKAAINFINTILQEDASIGIVTYDSSAYMVTDFSTNASRLTDTVDGIYAYGSTNIYDGLATASAMLQSTNAKKKIIVLMSDGMPNEGLEGDHLIAFADGLKDENILIYTLGFFENLGSDKVAAQALMEGIASEGCHYEVANADDLVFFFGDIADQINGQRYMYIRIACPVDVYVSYNGEVLSSSERNQNLRTDFGTITFEENEDDPDDPIKILRLKEATGYDVRIFGTGYGYMDYTIGFTDDNGEYTDQRVFGNIQITNQTVIDTVASRLDKTVLNVDTDGDGKYDIKYQASAYGYGREVKRSILPYIGIGAAVMMLLYFTLVYITNKRKTV